MVKLFLLILLWAEHLFWLNSLTINVIQLLDNYGEVGKQAECSAG